MTDEIDFEFRLFGVGWGEGRLVIGDSSVIVVASYLSDALGDLLSALRSLTEGAADANASSPARSSGYSAETAHPCTCKW
jgi:hypothetical protein